MYHHLPPPTADISVLPARFHGVAGPVYRLVNRYPPAVTFPVALTDAEVDTYLEVLSKVLHRSFQYLYIADSSSPPDRPHVDQATWLESVNAFVQTDDNLGFRTLRHKLCQVHHVSLVGVPDELHDRASYFFHAIEHRKNQIYFGPSYGDGVCQVLAAWMACPHPLLAKVIPLLLKAPPLGINPKDPRGYVVFSR